MIYFDYAATTPIDRRVLNTFNKAAKTYIGNPNSAHKLGCLATQAIEKSLNRMRRMLGLPPTYELVPTSGASESNNLVWKGILANKPLPCHIITTAFEHSSIIANANYYAKKGYTVDLVKTDQLGHIDLDHFKSLIKDETTLVSICSINSEIGIRQPLEAIKKILNKYPHVTLHVDATQSIGKEAIDLNNIDLISMTAHKIYGLKGIGLLIKKKTITLEPIIHGGHSTTLSRRGTPATELVLSFEKALSLLMPHLHQHYEHVQHLRNYTIKKLEAFKQIIFNSTVDDLPHILNLSIPGHSSKALVNYFSERDIYLSNHTACESENDFSGGVYALTNDIERANSSLRISFSHLSTIAEVDQLIAGFRQLL